MLTGSGRGDARKSSPGNRRLFKVVLACYMLFTSAYLVFVIVAGRDVESVVAAALPWIIGFLVWYHHRPRCPRG